MRSVLKLLIVVLSFLSGAAVAVAQEPKPGRLSTPELKQIVPNAYFFRGQSSTVQIRNSSGMRMPRGKVRFAALVDNSGYAHDVAERYQGLFVSEVKVKDPGRW